MFRLYLFSSLIFLSGCVSQNSYTSTYFDYSGKDGCAPANIGHRLGGDLEKYSSNTLEGMHGIAPLQESKCFKNWEFDVNQTADIIILRHDSTYNNIPLLNIKSEKISNALSLTEFVLAFDPIDVKKPVVIDLKSEISAFDWVLLIESARRIREKHKVPIWFIISQKLTGGSADTCQQVGGEFDILLYRKGGPLC